MSAALGKCVLIAGLLSSGAGAQCYIFSSLRDGVTVTVNITNRVTKNQFTTGGGDHTILNDYTAVTTITHGQSTEVFSGPGQGSVTATPAVGRSEEHTSELQSHSF